MRLAATFVVLVFLASQGTAVDSGKSRNGYWWGEMPPIEKLGYVQGYTDGMGHGSQLVASQTVLYNAKAGKGERKLDDSATVEFMDYSQATYGQLIEGLDTFYGDYRNKRIKVFYAILYVRDEIRGVAHEELEKRVESMRQGAAQEGYDDRPY